MPFATDNPIQSNVPFRHSIEVTNMNPSRRPIAIRILIAGIILAVVPVARASDPGMAAADQVSEATYRYLLGDNQGEPGILYTHNGDSRGLSGAEHDPARDNIQSHFESYGLTVTMEPFTYASNTYFNVVATKLGTVFPDQEYIIGAHFDSVGNPGADDNASGTALVLEAARILSQYDSDYTLRFIAFDREEQGLIGSNAYVSDHATDNILGMISADMVAFNTGTNMADIYGGSGSTMLKAALADAVALYGDGLNVALQGASGGSDHAPFEGAGFQACLFIEDWGNPNYHTAQDSVDTPNYIDYAFAVRMTRSVVGFLVDQAGVQVAIDALDFNYPNGQPEFIDPAGGTTMRVEVIGMGTEVPAPGTGMLNYDDGGGWQSVPMNVVADNIYDAVFPAVDCGTQVSYSISADSVSGGSYTDPAGAPASAYSVISGSGYTVSFSDDFEIDQGWTASAIGATGGFWERGVPVDDPNWAYDPASDSDGSGQCFLTGNQAGNSDVDDGAVLLMSPLL
ncbi:MAG: M28 family metallopeptidase, partial [Phycisphaerae bacterium]